ncbi:MAG: hypothetical protein Q9211_004918 [Gyalolechia sp. 1 TL-2023]
MASEDLDAAFQSLKIGRSTEEDNVFIKLSLCGWRVSAPNPDQSPHSTTNPFAAPWEKNGIQSADPIGSDFASLSLRRSLEEEELDPRFLCAAEDCPLQDRVHKRGYFRAAPNRGVVFRHPDFGCSDPPVEIWAAYFRYTGYAKEIGDHCRTVQDFIDLLIQKPFDDPRPEDASTVVSFLKYHAIDLRQGENHVEVVPWRGRVLTQVEPEIVGSLSMLAL